jgi:hypothetical protein
MVLAAPRWSALGNEDCFYCRDAQLTEIANKNTASDPNAENIPFVKVTGCVAPWPMANTTRPLLILR